MRVGVLGLGDIAQKAYLPVISTNEEIELLLCTRNAQILHEVSRKYHIQQAFTQIDQLLNANIDAIMIHAATEAHEALIEKCLKCGVHVFVDKPIAYDYASSKRLAALAKEKQLILMVGFNRRYSQPYLPYLKGPQADFIMVEKHRAQHPGDLRTFIFDDFIHVIDTILNFFRGPIKSMDLDGKILNNQLYRVLMTFKGEEQTAIGVMNRDAGMQQEMTKLFYPSETIVIENIRETIQFKNTNQTYVKPNDWAPTLDIRGFHKMTEAFFTLVKEADASKFDYETDLKRHEIAEQIVNVLEKQIHP